MTDLGLKNFFLQLGKYFSPTGKMIFCALSNHTTKVRQAHAAIIRFSTLQYDSIRFSTIPYDFTCYLAARGFLAVRPGSPRWALPRVRWATWRSFGSRRTCGRPSPPWACWGAGCVRMLREFLFIVLAEVATDGFHKSWQLALSCAAYLPPDCPSCRTFPSIFGRDAWILRHLRAIPGERKVLERWTGACLLRLLRAKTAYISCLGPGLACLEGWIYWYCIPHRSCSLMCQTTEYQLFRGNLGLGGIPTITVLQLLQF